MIHAKLDRIPSTVASPADFTTLARDRLAPGAFAYLTGGAGDGLTRDRNRVAFDALELVPVALVQNLARTLAELKQTGVTVIGLDGEGDMLIDDHPMQGAVAFVLGAEGKGLRQLTRETCDAVCRIGTSDALASLNVSNAAAIALHLSAMRRRAKNS